MEIVCWQGKMIQPDIGIAGVVQDVPTGQVRGELFIGRRQVALVKQPLAAAYPRHMCIAVKRNPVGAEAERSSYGMYQLIAVLARKPIDKVEIYRGKTHFPCVLRGFPYILKRLDAVDDP